MPRESSHACNPFGGESNEYGVVAEDDRHTAFENGTSVCIGDMAGRWTDDADEITAVDVLMPHAGGVLVLVIVRIVDDDAQLVLCEFDGVRHSLRMLSVPPTSQNAFSFLIDSSEMSPSSFNAGIALLKGNPRKKSISDEHIATVVSAECHGECARQWRLTLPRFAHKPQPVIQ